MCIVKAHSKAGYSTWYDSVCENVVSHGFKATNNKTASFTILTFAMIQGEQGVVTQNNKTAHHHIYKSQSLVLKPQSSIFQYIVTIRQYELQWGYYQTCKNLANPLVDSWHYREKQQGGGWCCRDRRTYRSYRLQHARGMIPRPRSHSESWGGKKTG